MGGDEHDRCPLCLMKVTDLPEESNQMVKERLKELGCLVHRREDSGDHHGCPQIMGDML